MFKPMLPRTVLVADDHRATRKVLRELLEIDGWAVMEARDGVEAVQKAAEGHPTAVVTDLGMPRMDGLGAARALRSNPRTADIYLIAVTAQELSEEQTTGLEAVFDDVLCKPVRPKTLRRRLAQAAGGSFNPGPGETRT